MRPLRIPLAALPLSILVLAFVAGVGAGGGCGSAGDEAARDSSSTPTNAVDPKPTPTPGDPALLTRNGTVRYLDLEGGFWGLVADDSTRYDPGTLDERFRVDGLRVRFDARVNEGQMSFRQWGTLVTIVRLDRL
jgi:hypothetical protein